MHTWISILLGGGILAFVQFLITRHDGKKEKKNETLIEVRKIHVAVDDLAKEMKTNDKKLNARMDRDKADQARNRILRFDDELRRKLDHSEEFFNQIMDDINNYRKYCRDNPDYENSKAETAMRHIEVCYTEVKAADKFI